ncbi:MAG: hypothetical protein LUQ38_00960, partial [Methanotrichaceae archaeon]|nr:hypothetical protein [Methanotrichaceae archaeon]
MGGKIWPMVVSALILILCLSGVQAQSITPTSVYPSGTNPGYSEAQGDVTQYSQYYTVPGGQFTGTHIIAPQAYDITGNTPTDLYFGTQQQAIPYSQYQTYISYPKSNFLWIQGETSWTQYAVVPQGAFLALIATSTTPGNGFLYEIKPNGQLGKDGYYFFPNNRLGFYADQIGRHILLTQIDDVVSNPIIIDVVPYSQPYYPPSYYAPAFVYYHYLFQFCHSGEWPCGDHCCHPGQVCVNGVCQSSCPSDHTPCEGKCCQPGQICDHGNCKTPSCPDGHLKCGDQCCQPGQVCENGACVTPTTCPHNQKCGNDCCQPGQVCSDGRCVTPAPSCPEGTTPCRDECCSHDQVCSDCRCVTPAPSCPEGTT